MLGAVVGCGAIAPRHLTAWAELADARIVAVCDANRERAEALGNSFGIDRVFCSMRDLLAAEGSRLDFVDITTPPGTRRPLIEQALDGGLHVLSQKPLAETLGEAREILALAQGYSAIVAVNEIWKWLPGYRKAFDLIASGKLGRIEYVRFSSTGNFLESWRTDPNYVGLFERLSPLGDLVLFEYGVHVLDLVRALFGEPIAVKASTAKFHPATVGEDAAWVRLEFREFSADITLDWCDGSDSDFDVLTSDHLAIRTDTGRLVVSAGSKVTWVCGGRAENWQFDPDPRAGGFRESQRDFLCSIAAGTAPGSTLADNLRTMELLFACYRSAAAQEKIRL
jgi:predicted dehydrogenase